MKKKIYKFVSVTVIAVAMVVSFQMSKAEGAATVSLEYVQSNAIAACESIGWWDNDGNCVKNDAGVYFCKSDSWPALTDCSQ